MFVSFIISALSYEKSEKRNKELFNKRYETEITSINNLISEMRKMYFDNEKIISEKEKIMIDKITQNGDVQLLNRYMSENNRNSTERFLAHIDRIKELENKKPRYKADEDRKNINSRIVGSLFILLFGIVIIGFKTSKYYNKLVVKN